MEYSVIRTPEQVIPYLKKLKEAKVLAVDTETTGLDAHKDRLRLVQIGAEGMPVLLIDCFLFEGFPGNRVSPGNPGGRGGENIP